MKGVSEIFFSQIHSESHVPCQSGKPVEGPDFLGDLAKLGSFMHCVDPSV
jgi:hypothetical protein